MALNTSSQGASVPFQNTHEQNEMKFWLCPHESLGFQEAQHLLATRGIRTTCGRASCHHTFTQVFMKHKLRSYGCKMLQLITSVNLFDIPCPTDEPEEACQLYCSLDRIATILNGLDLPICPHLKISSSFVLTQLRLRSISILEEREYIDECQCCTRSRSTHTLFRSPCRNVSHCLACFNGDHTKTAFFLQASRIVKRGRTIRLNIRLNIVRNLGSLGQPDDPAWLNHTFTNLDLHHLAAVWQEWDAKFLALHHLRRDWLHDLLPCHVKQRGQVLDGKRNSPSSLDPRHRSCRQNGYWTAIQDAWRREKQYWQTRKTLKSAAKEHFQDVAVLPDTDRLVQSVRKFGLRETLKAVWQELGEEMLPSHAVQQRQRLLRGRDAARRRTDSPHPFSRVAGGESWELVRLQANLELREEEEAREGRIR
jgi:hypothetical protein